MEKSIAVYEINETIKEVELNQEKIINIADIFNTIIGVSDEKTSHKAIIAEIKDDDSILKKYYMDKKNCKINSFAEKLLTAEKGNNSNRKKSIREGFLFIRETNQDLTLLKLEKTSVADTETFKLIGQLGTEKNYYKACIFTNDLHNIAIIDKSNKIATYWLDGFLGLQEVRNSKINSTDLIELVESKQLFSSSIKEKENFEDILSETKSYIFDNSQFDKSQLIDFLNAKDLIDIATNEKNYESQFYSEESLEIDANFKIDSKVLRDKYKREIKISNETTIKTDNFEKLVLNEEIEFTDNVLTLTVSDEFISKVEEILGSRNG
ncbi:Uncharacterised protein [Streptococcus criceti]|uniref:Nucleoid-associated protein n=1 Tax=Streptococcus criceti HS-6 TaxID=873449 RepID=G5JQ79_STRCG|nr:hypothetical protein [Streptococcus criceti]EHI73702.1 hypothetical protein STRCR_1762 [Streptococcus criceti HS-6]SUN43132.1 Uncharacterised protein [Streptococcus criceti]